MLLFSRSAVPNSLRAHGLQHRLPCPSQCPRVCSNSYPVRPCVAGIFSSVSGTLGFMSRCYPALRCVSHRLSSLSVFRALALAVDPLPLTSHGRVGPRSLLLFRLWVPGGALASPLAQSTLASAHGHSTQRPPPRPRFQAEARPVCRAGLPVSHLWPFCLRILHCLFPTSSPSCWLKIHSHAGVFGPPVSLLG